MQFPANPAGNDITDPAIPNPVPSVDTPFLTAKAYAFAPSDNNIRYVAYAGSYGSSVESVLSEANPAQVSNGELINRLLKSVDGGATYSIDLSMTYTILPMGRLFMFIHGITSHTSW
jgi:hypothetical protein